MNTSSGDEEMADSPFKVPPTPQLKKIGFGTGVQVYRFDRSPSGNTKSPWALKKVNNKVKRTKYIAGRLKTEAELLKTLNHPNIIGFRAFSNGTLAMEEGGSSLGDMIEKRRDENSPPFSPHEIIQVVKNIAKALHYIHDERRIIHGDIKSFNILIKENFNVVKLCDFGVFFRLDENGEASDYIGTECWSAPEVLIGNSVTIKADIFAFGLTIWEMMSLQVPHNDESIMDCSYDENSLPDPSENYGTRPSLLNNLGIEYTLPRELFLWCTEEDPDKRPTAFDILARLGETV